MKKLLLLFLLIFLTGIIEWALHSITPTTNSTTNNELRLRDCRKLTNYQDRTGCETIVLTKMAVTQIDHNIIESQKKSAKSTSILEQIDNQRQQGDVVKSKYKIDLLEDKMKGLTTKRSLLESTTFGLASNEYQQINSLLQDMIDDPIVKAKLNTILALKADIAKKVQPKIDKIRSVGKIILDKIKNQRETINKFLRDELIPLKKELDTLLLSQNADKELNVLRTQIAEYQTQLDNVLQQALTTSELQQMESLKTSKTRKQLMLKLLEDPEKVTDISMEELLGLIPIS